MVWKAFVIIKWGCEKFFASLSKFFFYYNELMTPCLFMSWLLFLWLKEEIWSFFFSFLFIYFWNYFIYCSLSKWVRQVEREVIAVITPCQTLRYGDHKDEHPTNVERVLDNFLAWGREIIRHIMNVEDNNNRKVEWWPWKKK